MISSEVANNFFKSLSIDNQNTLKQCKWSLNFKGDNVRIIFDCTNRKLAESIYKYRYDFIHVLLNVTECKRVFAGIYVCKRPKTGCIENCAELCNCFIKEFSITAVEFHALLQRVKARQYGH